MSCEDNELVMFSVVLGFSGYNKKHWYIMHESQLASVGVLGLVLQHAIHCRWRQLQEIQQSEGQWAISRHKHPWLLLWSLKVLFDHSALVWHVATTPNKHRRQMLHFKYLSPPVDTAR